MARVRRVRHVKRICEVAHLTNEGPKPSREALQAMDAEYMQRKKELKKRRVHGLA